MIPTPLTLQPRLRHWRLPIALGLIAVIAAAAGEHITQALRYERQSIFDGQLWRIATGNLVHLGWQHLAMNIAGLALIWALLHEVYSERVWLAIVALGAVAVSLGLMVFNPGIHWYVGLSGLLHGLFIAGVIGGLRRGEWRESLLLAGVVAKLAFEQFAGAVPGSAALAQGPVVVDAHLYGAVAGALGAAAFKPR